MKLEKKLAAMLLLPLLLNAGQAFACETPVFRYLLEHETPEPYELAAPPADSLTETQRALVKRIQASPINVAVREASKTTDAAARMRLARLDWNRAPGMDAPASANQSFWEGPLEEQAVERLLDSPARQELVRELCNDGVVFLFLDSGDKTRDDAAAFALRQFLDGENGKATTEPSGEAMPAGEKADQPPRPRFSIIRAGRDDPAEEVLAAVLLSLTPELKTKPEPAAFPVCGRGRIFAPLIGPDIALDPVAEICDLLAGPCSCEITLQNRPVYLPLSAEWDTALARAKALPDAARGNSRNTGDGPATSFPGKDLTTKYLMTAISVLVVLIAVSIIAWFFWRRRAAS